MDLVALSHVGSSSLTGYQTHLLCTGRQVLNHWTTREGPVSPCLLIVNFTWLAPLCQRAKAIFFYTIFYPYITLTFTPSFNHFDISSIMSTAVIEYHRFELQFLFIINFYLLNFLVLIAYSYLRIL